jgi:hypothetical protein
LALNNSTAKLSASERHIVDTYFEVLQPHCRTASVAEFRKARGQESPFASKMGGQFVGPPASAWPQSGDEYLEGVLQINIAELPWVPEPLQQFKLIQFFAAWKDWHGTATYENGPWFVSAYKNLDSLVPMERPFESLMESKYIQWKLAKHEIPSYPDNLGIVDEELEEDFHALDDWWLLLDEKYPTSNGTKIGGWPTSQQAGIPNGDTYVIQIDSICNWQWFADGVGFLSLDDSGEWDCFCDFH